MTQPDPAGDVGDAVTQAARILETAALAEGLPVRTLGRGSGDGREPWAAADRALAGHGRLLDLLDAVRPVVVIVSGRPVVAGLCKLCPDDGSIGLILDDDNGQEHLTLSELAVYMLEHMSVVHTEAFG